MHCCFFYFFDSNCLNFQFLTSDSDSTGRNPPMAHPRMSGNLQFGPKIAKNSFEKVYFLIRSGGYKAFVARRTD